jgi:RNA polymerase sigma-70 factor (ECF subfamily)
MQIEKRTSSSEEISESVLVERTLRGDQDAFAILVHYYSSELFLFLCRLTHNETEAEDILQQVFLKFYLALPSLSTTQPLKSWLFQVARHQCYDELRRKRAWTFSEVEEGGKQHKEMDLACLLDIRPSPEEIAEQHELQVSIQYAINMLPAKYRPIVLLRHERQLSFQEIALMLGIPEQTAKTYMHRAKPLLRTSLQEYALG